MGQVLIRRCSPEDDSIPPRTRRDPIPPLIRHKGPAWKPDNLIAPSSRFIINIFIKLIVEKSPGFLEQRADSFARGSSYHWWGCCQGNKPRLSWCRRPHDRQIAALCESDMGNLEPGMGENVFFWGGGDNHSCTCVLACEYQPVAAWKGDFFFPYMLFFPLFAFANHWSKRLRWLLLCRTIYIHHKYGWLFFSILY